MDVCTPLIKQLAKLLIFDAKIPPSEFEAMPLSKMMMYKDLYIEYVKDVERQSKHGS